MSIVDEYHERLVAEQATGCLGAGDYRIYAKEQGYEFVEVVDWCSSAGDWTFIVSKDGNEWFVMYQENNYPRPGFTREIEDGSEGGVWRTFWGPADEVLEAIYNTYYEE